jgi:hypothetical protein
MPRPENVAGEKRIKNNIGDENEKISERFE